ncbi:GGDEF domain-containing protein [Planctomonas deserti]|uniref:GGDEF domain-containing protein n=1 Tax=Planctomonas deserti TaxID=2144185 RepID=UPI000D3450CE|nr:GGDEF domain-containing protein [Planctomonas deserti]
MGMLSAVLNGIAGVGCLAIAGLILHAMYRRRQPTARPIRLAAAGLLAFTGMHLLRDAFMLFSSAADADSTMREVSSRPGNLVLDGLLALVALAVVALLVARPAPARTQSMFPWRPEQGSGTGTADPLTGLPNRAALLETLKDYEDDGRNAIVLDIDVHGLREVNADHGRDAGDRILRDVAQRLAGGIREQEYVFHLGGVEFVVLGIGHGPADAASLYSRTETLMSRSISVPGGALSVKNSVGTRFGTAGDLGDLLDQARGSALRASGHPTG